MSDWTLIEGDCLDLERGLASLARESVDLVLTDPPYGISGGGVHHGVPGKGSRRLDFFEGDDDWQASIRLAVMAAQQCLPSMTASASAYWWCGHRQFGPIVTEYEAHGFDTRFLVWRKHAPPPPPPGSGWPSGAELCVFAYRKGSRTWNHGGSNPPPSNVITADSFRFGQPDKVDHPTQKPLCLIEPLLLASSNPGDVVLDPFAGSGSIGVAALRLGRRYIGFEKEPKYAAIARKRLTAAREQRTLAL